MALKVLTSAQNWPKAAISSRDITLLRHNQCPYPLNNNFTRQQHRPSYRTNCDFASLIYRVVQISLRTMATQFTQLTWQSFFNHQMTWYKRLTHTTTQKGSGTSGGFPTPRNTPLTANGKRRFYHMTKFFLYLSFTVHYVHKKIINFTPVLAIYKN